jgi:hypothetical protein
VPRRASTHKKTAPPFAVYLSGVPAPDLLEALHIASLPEALHKLLIAWLWRRGLVNIHEAKQLMATGFHTVASEIDSLT